MSLAKISFKVLFRQFLDYLQPGVVEDNEEVIAEMGLEKFSPFYMVNIFDIAVSFIVAGKIAIIKTLVDLFREELESNWDFFEENLGQEDDKEYITLLENLRKLTGKELF